MTRPRCGSLVVHEYLLDPREGLRQVSEKEGGAICFENVVVQRTREALPFDEGDVRRRKCPLCCSANLLE
jgi:hypothetical protein